MDFNDPTAQEHPLPPPPPLAPALPHRRENPVFNLLDVGLIVIVTIVAFIACAVFAMAVFFVTHPSGGVDPQALATNALFVIPTQVATYILTIGFMVFYVWQRFRIGLLEAIGWNMPKGRTVWVALLGGCALAVISAVLEFLLRRWMPKSLPMEQFFRTPMSAYFLAAFGILVAPLVEEIFFRGFLYPALARPLGTGPAVVVTSAAFALLHSAQLAHAWAPLLVLFVVGSVLTVVRAVTKSVAMCVLIHMGYNFTLFAFLFIATQGFRHMERAVS